jgi:hypothetical protein
VNITLLPPFLPLCVDSADYIGECRRVEYVLLMDRCRHQVDFFSFSIFVFKRFRFFAALLFGLGR